MKSGEAQTLVSIARTRSYHPGGVNLAMADGSVHFIADSVDPDAFKAIGSRDGGELARGVFD
jgi:prepilin-type processing-associated H-X9-DG protein